MNKHIFPGLNNIIHFHLLPTPSLCVYDSLSTLLHIHGSAIIKLYLQLWPRSWTLKHRETSDSWTWTREFQVTSGLGCIEKYRHPENARRASSSSYAQSKKITKVILVRGGSPVTITREFNSSPSNRQMLANCFGSWILKCLFRS